MKRKLRFFSLFIVLFSVFLLSACQKNTRNVYQEVKKSNEITWGVKADTRLFGLMSIKTGKIEGFEVDLANALTKCQGKLCTNNCKNKNSTFEK